MKMLDYQKYIIEKVSFSKELFRNELVKSFKWLDNNEFSDLILWAINKFGEVYSEVIFRVSNEYVFNYKPNIASVLPINNFKKLDKL